MLAVAETSERIEIKKSVALIHSTSDITLLQKKISHGLLSNALPNMMTQELHSIEVSQLVGLTDYDSNDIANFKNSIIALQNKKIVFDIFNELGTTDGWGVGSIISWIEVRNGVCEYEYPSKLREVFANPDLYARIDLEMATRIKSAYSYIIYEICKLRAGLLGQRKAVYTQRYSIEDVHELLDTTHKASYAQYGILKKRVLNKAIKDVNTLSDIHIELEEEKTGQKVTSLRFKITPNATFKWGSDDNVIEGQVKETSDFKRLDEYKLITGTYEVAKGVAGKIFSERSLDYIKEKIAFTEDGIANNKISSTVAGYFVSAVKGDFKLTVKPTQKNTGPDVFKERLEQYRADAKVSLDKAVVKFGTDEKNTYLATLTDSEKEALLAEIRVKEPRVKNLTQPSVGHYIVARIDGYEKRLEAYVNRKGAQLDANIEAAMKKFKARRDEQVKQQQSELFDNA